MGILSPIEDLFEDGLTQIHVTTDLTWAWSIIALTAVVRIAIMPLTIKQTRSMLSMQRLQPYVKQLQQKYKDDRQELNERMMEFYRINRVNPLASCLPIVVQLPVFLALFFVLKDFKPTITSAGDRDFSFLFDFVSDIRTNIGDAGAAGWALLIFYVASQMLSSRVMMTTQNPQQKLLFMLLPVFFVPFVINFPIGVMLYWITTNLWTLGQHLVVVRLSTPIQEIKLPTDKGEKKIVPKAVKAELRRKAAGKAPDRSAAKSGGQSRAPAPPGVRRNKRRR